VLVACRPPATAPLRRGPPATSRPPRRALCSWQRHLLELPSEWAASFLTPIYSDHVNQSLEESTRLLMKAGEIMEEQ
jgi:hypothetical protein